MSMTALIAANTNARKKAASSGTNPWLSSQFYWLKKLATNPRGDAAREMSELMLSSFGYQIRVGPLAQSFIVNGHTVKVKLCMAWSGSKSLKFQQIEQDAYTHLLLLGLEPKDAWFWLSPQAVSWANAGGQHRQESRWIQFSVNRAPKWLAQYGGTIAKAQATCLAQLGSP